MYIKQIENLVKNIKYKESTFVNTKNKSINLPSTQ